MQWNTHRSLRAAAAQLTVGHKGESLMLKEEGHLLEALCVVLEHGPAAHAEESSDVFLPLDVALHDGLHLL